MYISNRFHRHLTAVWEQNRTDQVQMIDIQCKIYSVTLIGLRVL